MRNPEKKQPNQEYNFLLLLSSNIVSMFADIKKWIENL
nr:MAG TPA: Protein of unknown function (DUF3963) [Caudoviricetes sp.]